jgi:hypothetical protein
LGNTKIADLYEWEDLHHLHSIVRCFYTGCRVDKDAVGSFLGIPVQVQGPPEKFDYGDLLQAQTLCVRLDELGMIAVFNDSGAAMSWSHQRLQNITGPVSEIQFRELMVDFAYLNLRLKERPGYTSECDLDNETCRITVRHGSLVDLTDPDPAMRGALMHYVLKDVLPYLRHRTATDEEFLESVKDGTATFLFDNEGKFIERSIIPPVAD